MGRRRFCGGPQSYLKNWLLGSKKSYFIYIYWRIDKNRGLRCADLCFSEITAKIAIQMVKTYFFWRQGNHWANSADSKVEAFFLRLRVTELWSNSGVPQSIGPCKLSKNSKWATVPKRLITTGLATFYKVHFFY